MRYSNLREEAMTDNILTNAPEGSEGAIRHLIEHADAYTEMAQTTAHVMATILDLIGQHPMMGAMVGPDAVGDAQMVSRRLRTLIIAVNPDYNPFTGSYPSSDAPESTNTAALRRMGVDI